MANKKELLPFCRYYKGEKEKPDNASNLWGYEEVWVKMSENPEKNEVGFNTLSEYADEYIRNGLATFNASDGVPITLKALLHDRYRHFTGSSDGFKEWYKENYLKEKDES